jgi:heme-degrading monooxygenase HmoA
MLCALTVRQLKPGSFDQFRAAFMAGFDADNAPEGWVRFNMIRNADDPDEVITFGFFTGTTAQLRDPAARQEYDEQMKKIEPYVESVGADGFYDVVEDFSAARAPAA